jgi:hypothetical protein
MEWQRDRQIDTQLLLAVQEASMSELISTEIPITVRTFLWLLFDSFSKHLGCIGPSY